MSQKPRSRRVAKSDTKELVSNWRHEAATLFHNAMMSRSSLLRSMLDPRRDLDAECGYVTNPTKEEFDTMYRREGVARRVVHIWPDECWQVDPNIWESEDPDDTEFEKSWKELVERFDLYAVMAQSDVISGIGRFGILLFGLDGSEGLEKPPGKGPHKLLYLRALDESVVQIAKSETSIRDPRFGKPLLYNVQFKDEENTVISASVHWQRCIHLADNRRMSDVLGESRMGAVFNRLQDLRKLLGGSAEMFWQGAFPGLSFEIDPKFLEYGNVDIDKDALREEMQNYANGLQRWLSTTGVHVNNLAPQVADPSNHVEEQMRAIALALGIPYRVFMGTEEAKLAASQDSKTWSKRVMKRQRKYLTPFVIRPTIQRLIELGVLPEPKGQLHIDWPDMLTPSEQEKADVAKSFTEALKNYVTGDCEMVFPIKHLLTRVFGFSATEADIIKEDAQEAAEDHFAEKEEELELQKKYALPAVATAKKVPPTGKVPPTKTPKSQAV